MMTPNSNAPHRAVVWLSTEIHELLPTGECSGLPIDKTRTPYLVKLDADCLEAARSKLSGLLEEIRNLCQ